MGHLDKQKALEEGLLAPATDTIDSWHASESIAWPMIRAMLQPEATFSILQLLTFLGPGGDSLGYALGGHPSFKSPYELR